MSQTMKDLLAIQMINDIPTQYPLTQQSRGFGPNNRRVVNPVIYALIQSFIHVCDNYHVTLISLSKHLQIAFLICPGLLPIRLNF